MTDQQDDLQRVKERVADVNHESGVAVQRAARVTTTPHPVSDLQNTHDALIGAYQELVQAIDAVEAAIEAHSENPRVSTPRQIKDEHADRLKERYDGPALSVALLMVEQNRRKWLHQKPETQGAETVERHGLTSNQRQWLDELHEAWQATEQTATLSERSDG